MNNFWKLLTLFFLLSAGLAVLTHASGFSKSAGTLFTGLNTLGSTLSGVSTKTGSL